VLFSDSTVASQINEKFEPVWVSVREVPTVTIDFGNGHKLKRTLHGNVASYVLTADGTIIDVLPGIYEPQQYAQQLDQLWWLHRYSTKARNAATFLASYHREQEKAIEVSGKPNFVRPFADMSKMAIEISTKSILSPPSWRGGLIRRPAADTSALIENPDFTNPQHLRRWRKLFEDTQINERERRAQIHAILAAIPNAKPEDVTKRIYREVLHADLDDPYLGLGETLFKDYPFREDVPDALKLATDKHR